MPDPSPDHSLLVNESLRQRFEASWTVGTPEPLSECLPGTDTDEFGPTLEELIHIQLEFAWKAHSDDDGERPVSVQALLEEFPVLGDDAVLLRLLRRLHFLVLLLLIIATASLRIHLRLVWVASLLAVLSYGVVCGHSRWVRPDWRVPVHHHVVFLMALGTAGLLAGQAVRQTRRFAQDYRDRVKIAEGADRTDPPVD